MNRITKFSPFYWNTVLFRYASVNGLDLGKKSYKGWSLSVEPVNDDTCAFVIEHSGPGCPCFVYSREFPKDNKHWLNKTYRNMTFKDILWIYKRLSAQ